MDMPQAAAATLGGAAVSYFVGSTAVEGILLPILVFGGGIVVFGIFTVVATTIVLNKAGYNFESTHRFIVTHNIDILVQKTIHAWTKLNYEHVARPGQGLKI